MVGGGTGMETIYESKRFCESGRTDVLRHAVCFKASRVGRKRKSKKRSQPGITKITDPPPRRFCKGKQTVRKSRMYFALHSLPHIEKSHAKRGIQPLLCPGSEEIDTKGGETKRDRTELLNRIDHKKTVVLFSELRKCRQVHAQ